MGIRRHLILAAFWWMRMRDRLNARLTRGMTHKVKRRF